MKNIFTTLLLLIIITISVNGQSKEKKIHYDNGDLKIHCFYETPNQEKVIKKIHYYTQNQGRGLSKVETYRSGKLHGTITSWYINSKKKSEENYKDGKLHGTITSWNSLGKITEEIKYKDGTPLTKVVYTYYDNSVQRQVVNYRSNTIDWFLHGSSKEFNKSGNIQSEIIYESGIKSITRSFYDSGQVKDEHGPCKENKCKSKGWYENGVLKYENDLHSHKQYNHEGELYNPEEYDLSNMMDEMWEEGISKLDCATYQYSFRPTSKINMREALTDILSELVEDENIKSFITGIDVHSTEWATEFDEWWIKQRELCGVND